MGWKGGRKWGRLGRGEKKEGKMGGNWGRKGRIGREEWEQWGKWDQKRGWNKAEENEGKME